MLVVLDTNILVHELHLLRDGIGPPFLHSLGAVNGKLFIPSILRREYLEQSMFLVQKSQREIASRFRRIHAIVSEAAEIAFPTEEDVKSAFERRLVELEPITIHCETTDAIIIAAARRSFDGKAPSSKTDHGLKDCVIWESIRNLPPGSRVHLVTHDKAFYEGAELSATLKAEAAHANIEISATDNLGTVLTSLQQGKPPLDFDPVNRALDIALSSKETALELQWNLMPLGGLLKHELVPFYTEVVNRVFVEFSREYLAGDELLGDMNFANWRLAIAGSFTWHTDTNQLQELRIEREELLDTDGNTQRQNILLFAETGYLGAPPKRPFRNRGRLAPDR